MYTLSPEVIKNGIYDENGQPLRIMQDRDFVTLQRRLDALGDAINPTLGDVDFADIDYRFDQVRQIVDNTLSLP